MRRQDEPHNKKHHVRRERKRERKRKWEREEKTKTGRKGRQKNKGMQLKVLEQWFQNFSRLAPPWLPGGFLASLPPAPTIPSFLTHMQTFFHIFQIKNQIKHKSRSDSCSAWPNTSLYQFSWDSDVWKFSLNFLGYLLRIFDSNHVFLNNSKWMKFT